jgi:hypothetical protein
MEARGNGCSWILPHEYWVRSDKEKKEKKVTAEYSHMATP